jgi:hypothetical protein
VHDQLGPMLADEVEDTRAIANVEVVVVKPLRLAP